MNEVHLTDQDLQLYVLQQGTGLEYWIDHITHCQHCQRKAQLYSSVLEGVQRQQKPHFEFDLASLVVGQLEPVGPTGVFNQVLSGTLITVALVWMCIIFQWAGNKLLNLFAILSPMLTYLLFTTAGSLFLFLFIMMYRDFHNKMKGLSFG